VIPEVVANFQQDTLTMRVVLLPHKTFKYHYK